MKTLLVVDDDQAFNHLVSWHFLERGMRVYTAASFQEALRQCERRRIDAALIDYELPDGEGTELIRRFREAHPETALLMVSGAADEQVRQDVESQGAHTLMKPVSTEVLETEVDRILAGSDQSENP